MEKKNSSRSPPPNTPGQSNIIELSNSSKDCVEYLFINEFMRSAFAAKFFFSKPIEKSRVYNIPYYRGSESETKSKNKRKEDNPEEENDKLNKKLCSDEGGFYDVVKDNDETRSGKCSKEVKCVPNACATEFFKECHEHLLTNVKNNAPNSSHLQPNSFSSNSTADKSETKCFYSFNEHGDSDRDYMKTNLERPMAITNEEGRESLAPIYAPLLTLQQRRNASAIDISNPVLTVSAETSFGDRDGIQETVASNYHIEGRGEFHSGRQEEKTSDFDSSLRSEDMNHWPSDYSQHVNTSARVPYGAFNTKAQRVGREGGKYMYMDPEPFPTCVTSTPLGINNEISFEDEIHFDADSNDHKKGMPNTERTGVGRDEQNNFENCPVPVTSSIISSDASPTQLPKVQTDRKVRESGSTRVDPKVIKHNVKEFSSSGQLENFPLQEPAVLSAGVSHTATLSTTYSGTTFTSTASQTSNPLPPVSGKESSSTKPKLLTNKKCQACDCVLDPTENSTTYPKIYARAEEKPFHTLGESEPRSKEVVYSLCSDSPKVITSGKALDTAQIEILETEYVNMHNPCGDSQPVAAGLSHTTSGSTMTPNIDGESVKMHHKPHATATSSATADGKKRYSETICRDQTRSELLQRREKTDAEDEGRDMKCPGTATQMPIPPVPLNVDQSQPDLLRENPATSPKRTWEIYSGSNTCQKWKESKLELKGVEYQYSSGSQTAKVHDRASRTTTQIKAVESECVKPLHVKMQGNPHTTVKSSTTANEKERKRSHSEINCPLDDNKRDNSDQKKRSELLQTRGEAGAEDEKRKKENGFVKCAVTDTLPLLSVKSQPLTLQTENPASTSGSTTPMALGRHSMSVKVQQKPLTTATSSTTTDGKQRKKSCSESHCSLDDNNRDDGDKKKCELLQRREEADMIRTDSGSEKHNGVWSTSLLSGKRASDEDHSRDEETIFENSRSPTSQTTTFPLPISTIESLTAVIQSESQETAVGLNKNTEACDIILLSPVEGGTEEECQKSNCTFSRSECILPQFESPALDRVSCTTSRSTCITTTIVDGQYVEMQHRPLHTTSTSSTTADKKDSGINFSLDAHNGGERDHKKKSELQQRGTETCDIIITSTVESDLPQKVCKKSDYKSMSNSRFVDMYMYHPPCGARQPARVPHTTSRSIIIPMRTKRDGKSVKDQHKPHTTTTSSTTADGKERKLYSETNHSLDDNNENDIDEKKSELLQRREEADTEDEGRDEENNFGFTATQMPTTPPLLNTEELPPLKLKLVKEKSPNRTLEIHSDSNTRVVKKTCQKFEESELKSNDADYQPCSKSQTAITSAKGYSTDSGGITVPIQAMKNECGEAQLELFNTTCKSCPPIKHSCTTVRVSSGCMIVTCGCMIVTCGCMIVTCGSAEREGAKANEVWSGSLQRSETASDDDFGISISDSGSSTTFQTTTVSPYVSDDESLTPVKQPETLRKACTFNCHIVGTDITMSLTVYFARVTKEVYEKTDQKLRIYHKLESPTLAVVFCATFKYTCITTPTLYGKYVEMQHKLLYRHHTSATSSSTAGGKEGNLNNCSIDENKGDDSNQKRTLLLEKREKVGAKDDTRNNNLWKCAGMTSQMLTLPSPVNAEESPHAKLKSPHEENWACYHHVLDQRENISPSRTYIYSGPNTRVGKKICRTLQESEFESKDVGYLPSSDNQTATTSAKVIRTTAQIKAVCIKGQPKHSHTAKEKNCSIKYSSTAVTKSGKDTIGTDTCVEKGSAIGIYNNGVWSGSHETASDEDHSRHEESISKNGPSLTSQTAAFSPPVSANESLTPVIQLETQRKTRAFNCCVVDPNENITNIIMSVNDLVTKPREMKKVCGILSIMCSRSVDIIMSENDLVTKAREMKKVCEILSIMCSRSVGMYHLSYNDGQPVITVARVSHRTPRSITTPILSIIDGESLKVRHKPHTTATSSTTADGKEPCSKINWSLDNNSKDLKRDELLQKREKADAEDDGREKTCSESDDNNIDYTNLTFLLPPNKEDCTGTPKHHNTNMIEKRWQLCSDGLMVTGKCPNSMVEGSLVKRGKPGGKDQGKDKESATSGFTSLKIVERVEREYMEMQCGPSNTHNADSSTIVDEVNDQKKANNSCKKWESVKSSTLKDSVKYHFPTPLSTQPRLLHMGFAYYTVDVKSDKQFNHTSHPTESKCPTTQYSDSCVGYSPGAITPILVPTSSCENNGNSNDDKPQRISNSLEEVGIEGEGRKEKSKCSTPVTHLRKIDSRYDVRVKGKACNERDTEFITLPTPAQSQPHIGRQPQVHTEHDLWPKTVNNKNDINVGQIVRQCLCRGDCPQSKQEPNMCTELYPRHFVAQSGETTHTYTYKSESIPQEETIQVFPSNDSGCVVTNSTHSLGKELKPAHTTGNEIGSCTSPPNELYGEHGHGVSSNDTSSTQQEFKTTHTDLDWPNSSSVTTPVESASDHHSEFLVCHSGLPHDISSSGKNVLVLPHNEFQMGSNDVHQLESVDLPLTTLFSQNAEPTGTEYPKSFQTLASGDPNELCSYDSEYEEEDVASLKPHIGWQPQVHTEHDLRPKTVNNKNHINVGQIVREKRQCLCRGDNSQLKQEPNVPTKLYPKVFVAQSGENTPGVKLDEVENKPQEETLHKKVVPVSESFQDSGCVVTKSTHSTAKDPESPKLKPAHTTGNEISTCTSQSLSPNENTPELSGEHGHRVFSNDSSSTQQECTNTDLAQPNSFSVTPVESASDHHSEFLVCYSGLPHASGKNVLVLPHKEFHMGSNGVHQLESVDLTSNVPTKLYPKVFVAQSGENTPGVKLDEVESKPQEETLHKEVVPVSESFQDSGCVVTKSTHSTAKDPESPKLKPAHATGNEISTCTSQSLSPNENTPELSGEHGHRVSSNDSSSTQQERTNTDLAQPNSFSVTPVELASDHHSEFLVGYSGLPHASGKNVLVLPHKEFQMGSNGAHQLESVDLTSTLFSQNPELPGTEYPKSFQTLASGDPNELCSYDSEYEEEDVASLKPHIGWQPQVHTEHDLRPKTVNNKNHINVGQIVREKRQCLCRGDNSQLKQEPNVPTKLYPKVFVALSGENTPGVKLDEVESKPQEETLHKEVVPVSESFQDSGYVVTKSTHSAAKDPESPKLKPAHATGNEISTCTSQSLSPNENTPELSGEHGHRVSSNDSSSTQQERTNTDLAQPNSFSVTPVESASDHHSEFLVGYSGLPHASGKNVLVLPHKEFQMGSNGAHQLESVDLTSTLFSQNPELPGTEYPKSFQTLASGDPNELCSYDSEYEEEDVASLKPHIGWQPQVHTEHDLRPKTVNNKNHINVGQIVREKRQFLCRGDNSQLKQEPNVPTKLYPKSFVAQSGENTPGVKLDEVESKPQEETLHKEVVPVSESFQDSGCVVTKSTHSAAKDPESPKLKPAHATENEISTCTSQSLSPNENTPELSGEHGHRVSSNDSSSTQQERTNTDLAQPNSFSVTTVESASDHHSEFLVCYSGLPHASGKNVLVLPHKEFHMGSNGVHQLESVDLTSNVPTKLYPKVFVAQSGENTPGVKLDEVESKPQEETLHKEVVPVSESFQDSGCVVTKSTHSTAKDPESPKLKPAHATGNEISTCTSQSLSPNENIPELSGEHGHRVSSNDSSSTQQERTNTDLAQPNSFSVTPVELASDHHSEFLVGYSGLPHASGKNVLVLPHKEFQMGSNGAHQLESVDLTSTLFSQNPELPGTEYPKSFQTLASGDPNELCSYDSEYEEEDVASLKPHIGWQPQVHTEHDLRPKTVNNKNHINVGQIVREKRQCLCRGDNSQLKQEPNVPTKLYPKVFVALSGENTPGVKLDEVESKPQEETLHKEVVPVSESFQDSGCVVTKSTHSAAKDPESPKLKPAHATENEISTCTSQSLSPNENTPELSGEHGHRVSSNDSSSTQQERTNTDLAQPNSFSVTTVESASDHHSEFLVGYSGLPHASGKNVLVLPHKEFHMGSNGVHQLESVDLTSTLFSQNPELPGTEYPKSFQTLASGDPNELCSYDSEYEDDVLDDTDYEESVTPYIPLQHWVRIPQTFIDQVAPEDVGVILDESTWAIPSN